MSTQLTALRVENSRRTKSIFYNLQLSNQFPGLAGNYPNLAADPVDFTNILNPKYISGVFPGEVPGGSSETSYDPPYVNFCPAGYDAIFVPGTGTTLQTAWALQINTTANTPVASPATITISGWTASGQTLTFTGTNTLVSGQTVTLNGFTGGSVFLNGQVVTVLSAGLSTSAFEAVVTGTVGTTTAGQGLPSASIITITGWTASGQTLTFAATNTLTAGQTVVLSGFTGGSVFLNGQVVTVLAAGLTSSAFEAVVTGTVGTTAAGQGLQGYPASLIAEPLVISIRGGNWKL